MAAKESVWPNPYKWTLLKGKTHSALVVWGKLFKSNIRTSNFEKNEEKNVILFEQFDHPIWLKLKFSYV